MFRLARGKSCEPYGGTARWDEEFCSMPGTYNWSAHQTSAGLAGVQKKEKQAAGRELFLHTLGECHEPCPFRLPRTPEGSQRNMHSTALGLGRSSYPCVCSTATAILSKQTLEHSTISEPNTARWLRSTTLTPTPSTPSGHGRVFDSLSIGSVDADRLCSGRSQMSAMPEMMHVGSDFESRGK